MPWGKFCNLSSADIDECVTLSPCHANASCISTLESFTCVCNTGYTGDGITCYGKCLHVDCSSFKECNTGQARCWLWVMNTCMCFKTSLLYKQLLSSSWENALNIALHSHGAMSTYWPMLQHDCLMFLIISWHYITVYNWPFKSYW